MSDIHTKTTQIIARGAGNGGSTQQTGGGYDVEGSVKVFKPFSFNTKCSIKYTIVPTMIDVHNLQTFLL